MASEILCVGEVLWDALPAGLFLGGAPFNVACHARAAGLAATLVSRVGRDHLGEEALRRAARYGVRTDLVQLDDERPTGFVRVTVDEEGETTFDIVAPAAWDAIDADGALLRRAERARAIVFGTLAQRDQPSRGTIELLLGAPGDATRVFDVNLRRPHDDREVVRRSLSAADVVKVNEDELDRIGEWFGFDGEPKRMASAMADSFGCEVVCVTRGARGAALWHDGRWTEHGGFEVEVQDTVGAGDAFLAVLLAGLLKGSDDASVLQHANLMGAYVATQSGAVPADQPEARAHILAVTGEYLAISPEPVPPVTRKGR